MVSTHLKNRLVKLDHFPKDRGENKKSLKPPPRKQLLTSISQLRCAAPQLPFLKWRGFVVGFSLPSKHQIVVFMVLFFQAPKEKRNSHPLYWKKHLRLCSVFFNSQRRRSWWWRAAWSRTWTKNPHPPWGDLGRPTLGPGSQMGGGYEFRVPGNWDSSFWSFLQQKLWEF